MNGNYILMATFFKLRKYQTFGLIELHNLSKGQLADRIFKLWKSYFTITRPWNIQLVKFWLFNFPNFHITFSKNFMKKLPGFKMDFESINKEFTASPIFIIWNFSTMKQRPFEFFLKFARKSVLFHKFCQMREILKPQSC